MREGLSGVDNLAEGEVLCIPAFESDGSRGTKVDLRRNYVIHEVFWVITHLDDTKV